MNSTLTYWSVLLILGIFQGLFITPLLLKKKTQAGRWLAVLVLIIVLNLINYLIINLNIYRQFPHLLDIPLPLLFLIGPAYYFYIRSLLNKSFRLSSKYFWHFLPLLGAILYRRNFFLLSGEVKIQYIDFAKINTETEVSLGFILYVFCHIGLTLFYLIRSFYKLRDANISVNEQNRKFMRWLEAFSIGFAIYWLLTLVWVMYLVLANAYFFEADYLFMLITSVTIYILTYTAVYHNREFSQYLLSMLNEKYKNSSLSEEQSKGLLKKLLTLMENEQPYLDPDLKISDLAKRLHISTNLLSQVLNQELNKNFYEFLNEYRLAEAMKKLGDSKFSHITILGIALDSGFGNKNTFNRLFKKHTGLTPSQFLRNGSG